ncbi:MAG: hypothetical protein IJ740_08340 [Ruminococcus sp.]|nr:hypothetical protein [Ruminococcus sp.]
MKELYAISTTLDDVANSLTRVLSTLNLGFECFYDDTKTLSPALKERFEDYHDVLTLCADKLYDEQKTVDELSEKVFALFQQTKAKAGDVNE